MGAEIQTQKGTESVLGLLELLGLRTLRRFLGLLGLLGLACLAGLAGLAGWRERCLGERWLERCPEEPPRAVLSTCHVFHGENSIR